MNIASSLRLLRQVLADDNAYQSLGAPRGWYVRFFYRWRWFVRRNLQPPEETIVLTVNSHQIKLTVSGAYAGALKGIFLENEYDCRPFLQDSPCRILDLGANIGMGTLYMSTLFPEAEFVCVEPDPRNVPLLRKNLEQNGLKPRIVEAAIASAPGQLKLRFGNDPTCSALESSSMHVLEDFVSVPVRTVVAVMEEAEWDHIDLVKIDIEGTEDELLAEHSSWLQQTKAVIMEIHPNTTQERIASYLLPFDLELQRIGWKNEPVYFAQRS
jgi:FkbM family methyltransferase